jgi:integrase
MTTSVIYKPIGKKGKGLIGIRYDHKSKWTFFSTGHSIEPQFFKDGYVLNTHPQSFEINAKIDKLKGDILNVGRFLQTKHINPTIANVRNYYTPDLSLIPTPPPQPGSAIKELQEKLEVMRRENEQLAEALRISQATDTVFVYDSDLNISSQAQSASQFYEEAQTKQVASSSDLFFYFLDKYVIEVKEITESTRKQYKTLRNILFDFESETGFGISFATMTSQFYNAFAQWQLFVKDNYNNVFGARIKQLKSFLNYVNEHWKDEFKIEVNPAYRKFKKLQEDKEIIILTSEEIKKLYEYPFEENLVKYRDLLIFGCETGLRYSDIMRLRKQHTSGRALTMKAKKTKKSFCVILSDMALEILEKYKYNLGPLSEQNFNKYIKICCKLVGFDQLVTISRYKLKKEYQSDHEKYTLISSHSARRSFCCNRLKEGYSETEVMSMTGHSSHKEFQKYVKITPTVILDKFERLNKEKLKKENKKLNNANPTSLNKADSWDPTEEFNRSFDGLV